MSDETTFIDAICPHCKTGKSLNFARWRDDRFNYERSILFCDACNTIFKKTSLSDEEYISIKLKLEEEIGQTIFGLSLMFEKERRMLKELQQETQCNKSKTIIEDILQ